MFEFLEPVNWNGINGDEGYKDGQYGKHVHIYFEQEPDWQQADIILVGLHEERGRGVTAVNHHADAVRRQLYRLFCWHDTVRIADLGNIRTGATLKDTYAALQAVVDECLQQGKRVMILGGSHDCTLAQYQATARLHPAMEATCIDAKIDLSMESVFANDAFLMQMLTGDPNYIRHYNHIAFQTYFVHPRMMETMDRLRFDCYRLGRVKDKLTEMEPVLRNSHLVSVDVCALQPAFMPCNHESPNGLAGDEMCQLMRYAGMSGLAKTLGIYNYNSFEDVNGLGALQVAQMIWYFIDGHYQLQQEAPLSQRELFNEYHTAFAEVDTLFLQNKKTGRWWMQLPGQDFIACSPHDYALASRNEIPERWLRAQERNS
jgi:formiminoglutamase